MAVYTVGRFQPPTLGHVRMIREMLKIADGKPAFVFISSAKDSLIPSKLKVKFLTKMLTPLPKNLRLIDTALCKVQCGGPLGGWGYIKDMGMTGPTVTLVVGGDQGPKFDPATAPMWSTTAPDQRPSIVAIPREGEGAATFSSTKARKALATSGPPGLKPFLTDGTNAITDDDVAEMAAELLAVQAKWPENKKKGGSYEDDSAFDEDMEGGQRRKTRRLKRNKASGKALYRRGSRSRNGSSRNNRSSYGSRGCY
jgi:hypothetical protein